MTQKVLFCGDVNGNWPLLLERLETLQKSAHGPFDILFLIGKCFQSEAEYVELIEKHVSRLSLKTYCFDSPSYIQSYKVPVMIEFLNVNNYCGIITLENNLTISYVLNTSNPSTIELEKVKEVVTSPGYRGCDILISFEWPKDMHHFLDDQEILELKSTDIGIGSGSKLVSSYACLVKPRYHFVSGLGSFFQRSPYSNLNINNSSIDSYTRLLSIDSVSISKEKSKKWLHALSINPIIYLTPKEISELPVGTTDCPYTDDISMKGSSKNKLSTGLDSDHSLLMHKRIKTNDTSITSISQPTNFPPLPPGPPPPSSNNSNTGSFFFGNMGVPTNGININLTAPSTSACTLFIGGLLKNMNENDLESILVEVKSIKKPIGKSFAFVEFYNHNAAKNTVETSTRRGLSLHGRTLTVGWAKEKDSNIDTMKSNSNNIANEEYERILIPPSEDSKTLFIGSLSHYKCNEINIINATSDPTITSIDHNNNDNNNEESNYIASLQNDLNELMEGNIVKIYKNINKSYAFVEFDSYESAMNVITKSISESYYLQGKPLLIGWSNKEGNELLVNNNNESSFLLLDPPTIDSKVLFLGALPSNVIEYDIQSLFENIISIRRPEGKDYAFIEFNTHQDAQNAMNQRNEKSFPNQQSTNTTTTTTNNSINTTTTTNSINTTSLLIGWAKGRSADHHTQSSECWFCLASPVVKIHLIVSVGEFSYLAIPRGGINRYHVMLSPIECVPSRVHLSTVAKSEMIKYQHSLDIMYQKLNYVTLRFERALRTKGSRDHMQIHIIPLSISNIDINKTFSIFLQKASIYKLKFHEIQDDSQSIDEVVVTMEGGPYQEYFYIEIPISFSYQSNNNLNTYNNDNNNDNNNNSSSINNNNNNNNNRVNEIKHRRFVYVKEENVSSFPMQFGLEVAANILGQPERGHWKHNLQDEVVETKLCEDFRKEFELYDFTLT